MPTITGHSIVCLTASIVLVVLVGGCAGKAGDSNSATQAKTAAVAPTTTVPPLTEEDLAWLDAIPAVSMKVEKGLAAIVTLTPSAMTKLGNSLRTCTRELVQGVSVSDRLQPAYALVGDACKAYDKGAACFATAAKVGIPFAGSPAEKKQSKALDCGFAAPGEGALLLGDAANKGAEIKQETG